MLGPFNAHSMRMPSHRGNCDDAKAMRSTPEVTWGFRCARNFEKQQKSEVLKKPLVGFVYSISFSHPFFCSIMFLVVFCPAQSRVPAFRWSLGESNVVEISSSATFSASYLWEKIREDQWATDWLTLISVYVHVYIYTCIYIYIYTCLYNYIYVLI